MLVCRWWKIINACLTPLTMLIELTAPRWHKTHPAGEFFEFFFGEFKLYLNHDEAKTDKIEWGGLN